MEKFSQKTPVKATATFRDGDHDLADPDTVIFRFRLSPTGSPVSTYTYPADAAVVRESLGKFHCHLIGGAPGVWFCEAEGTGEVAAAVSDKFEIVASPFP
jgi:hypothetical protein